MAMPFGNEVCIEKRRKRVEGERPRRQVGESGWFLVVPAGELRQPFAQT
ncbi:MAG: hypothetical protein ACYC6Y_17935 [Thermoguttaceae bacterium]